jgi:hypothetical protein
MLGSESPSITSKWCLPASSTSNWRLENRATSRKRPVLPDKFRPLVGPYPGHQPEPAASGSSSTGLCLRFIGIDLQDVVHLGPHHRTQIVNAGNRGDAGDAAKNFRPAIRGSPLIIRVTRCPPAEWPVRRIGPAISPAAPMAAAISCAISGNPNLRAQGVARHRHGIPMRQRPCCQMRPDRFVERLPVAAMHEHRQPLGRTLGQKQIHGMAIARTVGKIRSAPSPLASMCFENLACFDHLGGNSAAPAIWAPFA